jgi:hypothetical protein
MDGRNQNWTVFQPHEYLLTGAHETRICRYRFTLFERAAYVSFGGHCVTSGVVDSPTSISWLTARSVRAHKKTTRNPFIGPTRWVFVYRGTPNERESWAAGRTIFELFAHISYGGDWVIDSTTREIRISARPAALRGTAVEQEEKQIEPDSPRTSGVYSQQTRSRDRAYDTRQQDDRQAESVVGADVNRDDRPLRFRGRHPGCRRPTYFGSLAC